MNEIEQELPPLVTPQTLSECTGIPIGTWAAWRSQGIGPSYVKANRRVLYPRSEIVKWLERGLVVTDGEPTK